MQAQVIKSSLKRRALNYSTRVVRTIMSMRTNTNKNKQVSVTAQSVPPVRVQQQSELQKRRPKHGPHAVDDIVNLSSRQGRIGNQADAQEIK